MSMHHNLYSQQGCENCKPCAKGGGNVARSAVLVTIAVCTAGIGLLILPFYKKCQYCGHNHFMNKHRPHFESGTQSMPATSAIPVPHKGTNFN